MKVIFNADDFGLSQGVNLGIMEAFKNGVVRSTTIMAGMAGFDHAAALAKENPGLKIGIHLTLTGGRSVGGVYKTITDEDGNFLKLSTFTDKIKKINLKEVEKEFEAQIQKVLSAGIEVDHFDSHHHVHTLAGIEDIYLKLAKKYNKKIRFQKKELLNGEYTDLQTTDGFTESFYAENVTVDHLKQIISEQTGESLEIMCHPAYVDYDLYQSSSYYIKRIMELHVLTGVELKDYLTQNHIQICSYSDL